MTYDPSSLFDKPGYIPLSLYIADIDDMRRHGPWKLPIRFGDRLHLKLLSFVSHNSWFSKFLYIEHPYIIGPAYAIILNALKNAGFFDTLSLKHAGIPGHYAYYLKKTLVLGGKNWELTGQGVAKSKAVALSKAIGEMTERMVTSVEDKNTDITSHTPDDLLASNTPVYFPPRFHRYLEIQKQRYDELNFDSKKQIEWVKGHDMCDGKQTLIPRQITSWFESARTKREFLLNPTSSGCAGYFTKAGAELRALLESVQRDGILTHWLTSTVPDVISSESLTDAQKKIVRDYKDRGVTITILNVTSLSIPTVCVVAIDTEADEPMVVITGCADTGFERAIDGALNEVPACADMFRFIPPEGARYDHEPFLSHLDKRGRQLYWRGKEKVKKFDWFISGTHVSLERLKKDDIDASDNDAARLRSCLVTLRGFGKDYQPVVYHPKNRLSESLGFFVAQVYIPKAFPLYLVEKYGTFDSDRLSEFARSHGHDSLKLNSEPHPMT